MDDTSDPELHVSSISDLLGRVARRRSRLRAGLVVLGLFAAATAGAQGIKPDLFNHPSIRAQREQAAAGLFQKSTSPNPHASGPQIVFLPTYYGAPAPPGASYTVTTLCIGPGEGRGAAVEVPFGVYRGDGLLGISASNTFNDCVPNRGCSSSSYGEILQPRGGTTPGWDFSQGARLTAKFAISSELPETTNRGPECHSVIQYQYETKDSVMLFRDEGGERECVYTCGRGSRCKDPGTLNVGEGQSCFRSLPRRAWSDEGQASLEIIDDPATSGDDKIAIIHFASGVTERLELRAGPPRGEAYKGPFRFAPQPFVSAGEWTTTRVTDPNGNVTRYDYDESLRKLRIEDVRGRTTTFQYGSDGTLQSATAPGVGGALQTWTYTWSPLTFDLAALFPDLCFSTFVCREPFSVRPVLRKITLPDGRFYEFGYDFPATYKFGALTGWGNVTRVTYPEGAVTEFIYGDDTTPGNGAYCGIVTQSVPPYPLAIYDGVARRRVIAVTNHPSGPTGPAYTTTISSEGTSLGSPLDGPGQCYFLSWTRYGRPDGSSSREAECYARGEPSYFHAHGIPAEHRRTFAEEVYDSAGNLVTGTYYGNNGALGVTGVGAVGSMFIQNEMLKLLTLSFPLTSAVDVRTTREARVLDGIWSQETFTYEPGGPSYFRLPTQDANVFRTFGNRTESRTLRADGGVLLRATSDYFHPANYFSRGLRKLVSNVKVFDGTGALVAQSDSRYDETGVEPAPGIDAARIDRSVGAVRGNLTSETAFLQPGARTGPVRSATSYFETGDPLALVNGRNIEADRALEVDFGVCSSSHPTVTESSRNALGHVTKIVKDCWTGVVLSVEEPTGAKTCNQYDRWGRLVATAGPGDSLPATPDGGISGTCGEGSGGPSTSIRYLPAEASGQLPNGPTGTVTCVKDGMDEGLCSTVFRDGIGRPFETCSETVDPAVVDPDRDDASTVQRCTFTKYDSVGRVAEVSEPYTRARSDVPSSDWPTNTVFTRTAYDAIGRTTSVEVVGSGLSPVTTTYGAEDGRFVTTTTVPSQEQDGTSTAERVTKTYRNLLGQVVEVRNKCSSCEGGWRATTVDNDALGRILRITDPFGNVTRFEYDGLGRRTVLVDPDLGLWVYGYDANTNLVSRADSKGQITRIRYDLLDRPTEEDIWPPGADEQDARSYYDGAGPTTCGSCEDYCAGTDDVCDTATLTCKHTLRSGGTACDPASSPPLVPSTGCGVMAPNQTLTPGMGVMSCDGRFTFTLQSDGSVALFQNSVPFRDTPPRQRLWTNGMVNASPGGLSLHPDGNLVEYTTAGQPFWSTSTNGHLGAFLEVRNDGNAALLEGDQVVWSTNTGGHWAANPPPSGSPCGVLSPGQALGPDQLLRSCDGRFTLLLQSDGNVVLYRGMVPLWASGTLGSDRAVLAMEPGGNLVVYTSAGAPVWTSETGQFPGGHLSVQNDGNLVIYQGARPVWASNTCCQP